MRMISYIVASRDSVAAAPRKGLQVRKAYPLIISLALLASSLEAGPQASSRAQPPASVQQPGQGELRQVDESTPAAPVDPKTYQIGPEDVLLIRVWREPELSGSVVVRPDGKISLPLIGEVTAGGRTPAELDQEITQRLSEFINNPEVLVQVLAVRSKKYYIMGKVNRTGAFPLVVPITVLEALSEAGGFQPWAKRNKIVILRGNQRLRFNYDEVVKGKRLEQNIYLQNGDYIIVP